MTEATQHTQCLHSASAKWNHTRPPSRCKRELRGLVCNPVGLFRKSSGELHALASVWTPEGPEKAVPRMPGSTLVWFEARGVRSGASAKQPACQHRRHRRCGPNPWVGRSPGEATGSPLQCSCLENPTDRGAWRAPWGHKESDTTEATEQERTMIW